MSKSSPRRFAQVRPAVLVALHEADEASARDIAVAIDMPVTSVNYAMQKLEVAGAVEFVGVQEFVKPNGEIGQGRPAHVFKLSSKGVKQARRILA